MDTTKCVTIRPTLSTPKSYISLVNYHLTSVGRIMRHASDGDSRRRQLMLANFKSTVGTCPDIGWEMWIFTTSLDEKGDARILHNQNYLHNGKNIISQLLLATRTLQLGGNLYLHQRIELMFEKF